MDKAVSAVLHQVASAVRAAACFSDEEWALSLFVPRIQIGSELPQSVQVISIPTRRNLSGELVSINADFMGVMAEPDVVVSLLAMELEPFVIGAGKVRVKRTAEGFVLLGLDARQIEGKHAIKAPVLSVGDRE